MASYVDKIFFEVTESSSILQISYLVDSKKLAIKFKNNTYYLYEEVPISILLSFLNTITVGTHFYNIIRKENNFKTTQISESDYEELFLTS